MIHNIHMCVMYEVISVGVCVCVCACLWVYKCTLGCGGPQLMFDLFPPCLCFLRHTLTENKALPFELG